MLLLYWNDYTNIKDKKKIKKNCHVSKLKIFLFTYVQIFFSFILFTKI